MKTSFKITSLTFQLDLVDAESELDKYRDIILSYGAKPVESDSNYLKFNAKILQHFCYNAFVWTSSTHLSLNKSKQNLEYSVYYPFPILIFSALLLIGVVIFEPVVQLGSIAFFFRYVSVIYFMQKDIVKKLNEVENENRYMELISSLY